MAKIVLTSLLLLAIGVALVLLLRRDRGPAMSEAAIKPLSPVEEAQRATQAWVSERMQDPEYRKQLKALDERRTALAVEANELEREINAWQRRLAQENQDLADLIAQLTLLRQQTPEDESAAAATAELDVRIQTLMAQDPQGAALVTKQNGLKVRRDALQQEALQTVGLRMQRQQAEAFGQTASNPVRAGGAK